MPNYIFINYVDLSSWFNISTAKIRRPLFDCLKGGLLRLCDDVTIFFFEIREYTCVFPDKDHFILYTNQL